MQLQLDQFNYTLPDSLVAQTPAEPRDSSKLLVVGRESLELQDTQFLHLADFLQPGDVIVRNNSKVIPARILGRKLTGGKVELLLNKLIAQTAQTTTWECLTKPGLKPGHGQQVTFEGTNVTATCVPTADFESFTRHIEFSQPFTQLMQTLEQVGSTPLPPYIETSDSADIKAKYQTTYAKYDGSVAAPTAGLHFTDRVEQSLKEKGVEIYEVTLHVGMGTFAPVKDQNVTNHHMHEEIFELSEEVAAALNAAKAAGRRIIAVGTTTVRVLETCAAASTTTPAHLYPQNSATSIYIYPPYQFKFVDGLITNFHLPKSTLLMLISAFTTAPNTSHHFENFLTTPAGIAYQHALHNNYRFFSFGDSMLLL